MHLRLTYTIKFLMTSFDLNFLECCWRIKVAFTNGHSDTPVYKLHRYIYGYYEMEPGLVNGRPHYSSIHGDGLFALAFCGDR